MMAFAPLPHKEHILTNASSSFVHPTSKSFQMNQKSHVHSNNFTNKRNEIKDDLHSSRPGVFSPPPRPIRSTVRPAAEVRAAREKAEISSTSFKMNEEQMDETMEEEEEDEEQNSEEDQIETKINNNRTTSWTERSMSLDEAEQQRSINAFRTTTAANRPRLDSAPSGIGSHYRSRSHFSIPDIAIISADEEGNEVRYELQLEQAKRRLILNPSKVIESKDDKDHIALDEVSKQQLKSPATTKAKAQLAMFTFPSSSSNGNQEGGKKKSSKSSNLSRIPPSIHVVNTEGQSRILDASEAAKFPLPLSPTSPTSSSQGLQDQQSQTSIHSVNDQVFQSESAPIITNSTTMTGKIGKRLRKSSLPNLFGKKERDAANAAAMQIMPIDGTNESFVQSSSNIRQHVFVARQSSDPVSINESLSGIGNGGNASQYVAGHNAEVPTSPPISQVPSSPTSTMGRPSSTTSLTKKEVKQRQKEEKNLIKELEKVDKMVRKHDEKAIKAQKKAEEKKRKEERKQQKKENTIQRQISAPIAVTVMPASQAIHSIIPTQAAGTKEAERSITYQTPITTPSPLEELRNSSFDESSFPKQINYKEQKSTEPLFIEPRYDQDKKKKEEKQSLEKEDDENTHQIDDAHTYQEDEQESQLPQLSKAAPRISLLPNTVASLSLFDSLYKEVDAMESSFGIQYPVEAQERRKSVASSSAPQSPKFL